MMDLIDLQSAAQFVEEKFDATEKEIEAWIFDNVNKFPRYDYERNSCEQGGYYDRNTIENFDFLNKSPYPRLQRVSRVDILGNVISGLEAITILRKKYPKHSEPTISNLLSSTNAYTSNKPDKNGMLVVNWNIIANHLDLHYSEKEVNNLVLKPENQWISFDDLMARHRWKEFRELDVIKRLQTLNFEKRLRVFDPNHWIPGHLDSTFMGRDGSGKEIISSKWKHTSHYGIEAQALIESREALFQLSEIITIEENLFTEPEQKEPSRNATKDIVKVYFEQELVKIKNGEEKLPLNKQKMVEKIVKADLKGSQLLEVKKGTIERILSDLEYKCRINSIKSSKKN